MQHLLHLGRQLACHQQLGLACNQIHGLGTHGLQCHGTAYGGLAAAQTMPQGNAPASQQQPRKGQQAQPPAHESVGQSRQQGRAQRRYGGHQQAQIKIVQGIHIGGQTLQQPCRALQQQAGALRAGPAQKQSLAQSGQHGQRGIVGHQAFGITGAGSAHSQQANAGRRHEHIEHQGCGWHQPGQGRGRDEPARQAQQSHTHQHSERSQGSTAQPEIARRHLAQQLQHLAH